MKRVALVLTAMMAAACGGSSASPSAITTPTLNVVTDTFTGTVQPPVNGQGQFDLHNFTVAGAGSLTITLTAAGPPTTIKMGVGIGSPNAAGTCVLLSSSAAVEVAASTTPALSGSLTSAGTYCVAVFDTGNVLQTVTYSITVVHT